MANQQQPTEHVATEAPPIPLQALADKAELRARLCEILRQPAYGVIHASLFGSFARGEDRPLADPDPSDIDLLVELKPGVTLFGLIRLQQALEDTTGRSVDSITDRQLARAHPLMREHILPDCEPLL